MTNADETYEHSDLILAATVALLTGVDGDMNKRGDVVVWTYRMTPRLSEVIKQFASHDCRVEPMEFARILRVTRSKVYTMMGYNPPRVQRAPDRS